MDSRRTFISTLGAMALSSSRVLGANDRIRLGMIGVGARGTELAPSVKDENTEFVAFSDIYSARSEAAAKIAPRAKFYKDYRDLLGDSSVDAVIIATPQHLHAEHFVAALDAGKHVYQEKTMAFTVAHAKRMRAARRKASRLTVQVGHQDCSSKQNGDVASILRTGYMGQITEIHSHMYRNTPHGQAQWKRAVAPDMTVDNIAWQAFLGEAPRRAFDANRYRNWRFFWDYSGGNFYENMCHQLAFWYKTLDLAIPTRVCSNGGVLLWKDGREVPDTMNASMLHGDRLLFTWDSAFGNNQLGITEDVLGTDGTMSRGERIEYRPQKINRPDGKDIVGQGVDVGQRALDVAHLQNFLDCIRSGKETNCPFDLGFRVAIACRMAVDSYRFSRVLRWDAAREEIVPA